MTPVAPSQGMMIESLNAGLDAHRGAPDKTPERRLATLEAAGELQIAYTTGILVGIGESRADRIETYRGYIDNIQGSWVKLGFRSIEQLLQAGVNDLGGTLMDENISRAAGAEHGQGASAEKFERLIGPLGRRLVQRTTLYGRVDPDSAPPCNGNGARRVRVPVRAS